jgi:nitroreductase
MTSQPVSPVLDALARRRSVKPMLMSQEAPSAAHVETMLTIAARTPDHGKLVPWRFVVIAGEARERLGEGLAALFAADNPEADAGMLAFERKRLMRAPVVIGVVSRAQPHAKIPEWEQVLSAGAVCMNLSHAAFALGYAANWLTEWCAYDRRALALFGLKPEERMAGLIYIGRPTQPPEERERPALADVVTHL